MYYTFYKNPSFLSIFSEIFYLLINCGIKSEKQIDFANIIFWYYNINKILKKFINQIILDGERKKDKNCKF